MSGMAQDLWPEDIAVTDLISPISILKEQAAHLGEKTQNLVKGEVVQDSANNQSFAYSFYLVAPALQHYKYRLFRVIHPVSFYPLMLAFDVSSSQATVNNQSELIENLRTFFADENTTKVIKALIAQSSK